MAVADSVAFSLRALVAEVVRQHAGAAGGQAVDSIVREVDRRVPPEMSRAVYLESLAAIVRDVAMEERRRKWDVPPPVPPVPAVAPVFPVVPSPVVVAGEVVAEPEAQALSGGDPEPGGPEEGTELSGGEEAGGIPESAQEPAAQEAAAPVPVGFDRCPMTELPVYSCAHCRGDDSAEDDELRLNRELRERIEAGMDRLRAVEEVLGLLPPSDGPLRAAARAALLRSASKIERQISRETERAALARGERVTSLERAAAAMRLGETPFKLQNGESVTWEDATRAQHNARIAWMDGLRVTAANDAGLHRRAVRLLEEHGARSLKEIRGWEDKLGEIPAIEPGDVA